MLSSFPQFCDDAILKRYCAAIFNSEVWGRAGLHGQAVCCQSLGFVGWLVCLLFSFVRFIYYLFITTLFYLFIYLVIYLCISLKCSRHKKRNEAKTEAKIKTGNYRRWEENEENGKKGGNKKNDSKTFGRSEVYPPVSSLRRKKIRFRGWFFTHFSFLLYFIFLYLIYFFLISVVVFLFFYSCSIPFNKSLGFPSIQLRLNLVVATSLPLIHFSISLSISFSFSPYISFFTFLL